MSRLVVFSIAFGIAGAIAAERKGRNWALWGALCFFFPFLFILILLLPPTLSKGATKRCPNCGRIIRHNASFCKHCGDEQPIEMARCPHCGKFVPDRDYCAECHRGLKS